MVGRGFRGVFLPLPHPAAHTSCIPPLKARTELIGLMDVDMLVSSKLAKSMAIPERTNIMIDTCRWGTGKGLKQGWAHTQQAHLSCFSCWIDRGA